MCSMLRTEPDRLRPAELLLNRYRLLAAIVLAFGASSVCAQPAPEPTTGRLIVKLRDSASMEPQTLALARLARLQAAAASEGVTLVPLRQMAQGAHVMALDRRLTRSAAQALAARLAQSPDVEYVQPDYRRHASRVPNDGRFGAQWYLASAAYASRAVDAWDVTTGSPSVVVAVVDSGYRPHEDLAGRILPGYDFIADPKVANDGDGRDSDATDPGNWVDALDQNDPEFEDCDVQSSNWHGTSVMGIIGANANNSIWVAGMNWAANLLPVRVLGKCGGYDSDILDGVAWAAGLAVPGAPANPHPAQVINMSLGGEGDCPPAYHSIFGAALAHGVTRAIVVSAGNDGGDVASHSPANCSEAIAVAASTRVGTLASYSNHGPKVALSAPGGSGPKLATSGIAVLTDRGTAGPVGDASADEEGTSFAAPIVSGVASLVLAVAPNLSAAQLRALLTTAVSPFSTLADCTAGQCGSGIVDAHAAVLAAQALTAGGANYQGLWWKSPANSESGWGLNLAHQGDTIFASWFTYDTSGRAWWLVMTAGKSGPNSYSGTLYQTRGPAFNAVPWSPTAVTNTVAGSGTLVFSDANNGTFSYTVGAVTQIKAITRQVFGAVPVCTWGGQPNLALATNYQDLWWAAPAASESGWGVNLNHQGNTIFATWFTYDIDGSPLWLVATTHPTSDPKVYSGAFYRTSGARFDAFNPASVASTPVGFLTLTFTDGNHATMSYTVQVAGMGSPASQTKAITREVFAAPGTTCQ
jgi:serine protease